MQAELIGYCNSESVQEEIKVAKAAKQYQAIELAAAVAVALLRFALP
jgi:hypothetical protein